MHCIVESQRSAFVESLSNKRLYSFLMDGTTDASNEEDEIVVIMSFRKDNTAWMVGSLSWRCLLCVYSYLKQVLKWPNHLSQ